MLELTYEKIRDPIERKRVWVEIAIVVLVAAFPFYVSLFTLPPPPRMTVLQASISYVIHGLPICGVVLYIMWRSRAGWTHFGLGRNLDVTGCGFFATVLISGLALIPVLMSAFHMAWPMDPAAYELANQYVAIPKTAADWIPLMISLIVMAAAEELAMRGFLTTRVFDMTGSKLLAVVLPGLLFAGYHLYQGVAAALAICVEGLLLGWIMISTRRLKVLIVGHVILNIVAFATRMQ